MPVPAPAEFALTTETQQLFPTKLAAFEDAVESEIEEEIEEVGFLLENYCNDQRGTVDEISLDSGTVELGPDGLGEMSVSFIESAHYGCKDANYSDARGMTLTLRYDPSKGVLRAFGYEIPERDADDL